MARQMAFLVEQGHDAFFSESYQSARMVLTCEIEVEAAKQLAKARMDRATGNIRGGGSSGAAEGE